MTFCFVNISPSFFLSVLFSENPDLESQYRQLLRQVRQLPKDSRDYYRRIVREKTRAHSDEEDADRIKLICERSLADAQWVLAKVLFTIFQ